MSHTHSLVEHTSATSHDTHVHSSVAGQALSWVAIVFAGFGMLEILVSLIVGHPAATVFADGTHNLVDALGLFGASKIEQMLARTDHPLSAFGRKLLTVTIGAIGPLSYGLSLLAWSAGKASPLSARETIIMLAIGGMSFWINKRCHSGTADHDHAGLSAHLLADMAGAAAVVLTTVVVALDMPVSAGLATFIAISTFNVMAYLTWKELSPTIVSLAPDIAKLAASWLSSSPVSTQAEPVPNQPPFLVPLTVVHDHAAPHDHQTVHVEQALHVAAAIRDLTTSLTHNSNGHTGPAGGDQDQTHAAGCRLPASAAQTIVSELQALRQAIRTSLVHSPHLSMASGGG